MSQPQRTLPQSKEALLKSYRTRLKDDVKSMLENFEGNYEFRLILNLNIIFGVNDNGPNDIIVGNFWIN